MLPRASRCIGLTAVAVFLLTLGWTLARLQATVHLADSWPYTSPLKREVIGLVFFGRREFVRVLDCYLKVSYFFVTLPSRATLPLCLLRLYIHGEVARTKQFI